VILTRCRRVGLHHAIRLEHAFDGYNKLAATSKPADAVNSTGQILNQMTCVRAPVRAVRPAKDTNKKAVAR